MDCVDEIQKICRWAEPLQAALGQVLRSTYRACHRQCL